MGKRFSRFASGIHIIDFGQKNVCIFAKIRQEKHLSFLTYQRLKAKLIRQGRRSAWLLEGAGKPSFQFEFVDNRPLWPLRLIKFESRLSSLWLLWGETLAQHVMRVFEYAHRQIRSCNGSRKEQVQGFLSIVGESFISM